MTDSSETVYVAINRSDAQQTIGGFPPISYRELIGGGMDIGPTLALSARSAAILVGEP